MIQLIFFTIFAYARASCPTTYGAKPKYIIDVRSQSEYDTDNLSCAPLLPSSNTNHISEISSHVSHQKDARIFIFCASGGRAGGTVSGLQSAGFTNVVNVNGLNIPSGNKAILESYCTCQAMCSQTCSDEFTNCL